MLLTHSNAYAIIINLKTINNRAYSSQIYIITGDEKVAD